jgi:type I restriction enzyme S subunit
MEVLTEKKAGLKQTKLGWIPEGWEVRGLGQVAKIGNGATPSKSKDDYWVDGSIPWLPTGKVNDRIIKIAEIFITPQALKETSVKLLPKGTLLLAMIGQGKTRGKVAYLEVEASINQNFAYIRPKNEVNSWYLFYYLERQYQKIRGEGRGGNQDAINCRIVSGYQVIIPPLPEQKAIAACLGTWDKAIDTLNRLIAQKEQCKKGLMQQLLTGKKRLPGFSSEWKEIVFSDVAKRVSRRNIELHDNVVTISAQRGFVRQEDFFNKRVASDTLANYYLVEKGEFAYNKSYSNGYPMGAFKRLDDFEKAVVTTLYICFKIREGADPDFMKHFFDAGLMNRGLTRIAQEGGRAHGLLNIGLSDFFGLPLEIPKLEEQQAIAEVLNAANTEITLLQQKLKQLKQQKKGLMQQLLTGKKRLV